MAPNPSMQEAMYNFTMACFVGEKDFPKPSDADFSALINSLEGAASLSATEVCTWPIGMRAAMREVLFEFVARLMLSPAAGQPGTAQDCTPTRLGEEAVAAVARGAMTIRARLQGG